MIIYVDDAYNLFNTGFFDEISQLFTQNFSEQNWYQLCDVMSVVCGGEYHDHMFTLRAPISN